LSPSKEPIEESDIAPANDASADAADEDRSESTLPGKSQEKEGTNDDASSPIMEAESKKKERLTSPVTRSQTRLTPDKNEEVEVVAPPDDSYKRGGEKCIDQEKGSSKKKRCV